MVVVPRSSEGRTDKEGERQQGRPRKRSLAIAAREVTVEQFLKFDQDHWHAGEEFLRGSKRHQGDKVTPLTNDYPINWVSWYKAAAYCNWLSQEEGIPKDQWCYVPNEKGKYAAGMRLAANHEQLAGYRLPTEAEWEVACRAGAVTAFSFGEPGDVLGKYAWFRPNSVEKLHPTGLLKPNDWGLFDMHGNAWEWCQDRFTEMPSKGDRSATPPIIDADQCVMRGGSFHSPLSTLRCGTRRPNEPEDCDDNISFRPARILADE
jgi:formylglycine-generating enzyme required for sulfatase activity